MGSSVLLPHPGQPGPMKAGEFESSFVDNVVSFAFRRLSPPTPLYIQRDDTIVIQAATGLAAETITFLGRFIPAPAPRGGQPGSKPLKPLSEEELLSTAAIIIPFTGQFIIPSNLTQNNPLMGATAIHLGEGYIVSLAATSLNATQRGQTFVEAYIQRLTGGTANVTTPLFADYLTKRHHAGWPNGRFNHMVEGPGSIQSLNIANPAPGADWIMTTPVAIRRRVQSVNAQLLTSATVANRIVRGQIKDGAGNIVWQGPPSAVITAGLTVQVSMSSGQVTSATDPQTVNIALPSPAILEAGFTLGTNTTNIQVGDQWSAIWFENEDLIDAA